MSQPSAKKMRQESTKDEKKRIIELLKENSENMELRTKPGFGKEICRLDFKVFYIHEKDASGKFCCNRDFLICNSEICRKKSFEQKVSYINKES